MITVDLADLMPYLYGYSLLEDFVWSMDNNRDTESILKDLTEAGVPLLHISADRSTIQVARASASSGAAELAGKDTSNAVFIQLARDQEEQAGLAQG